MANQAPLRASQCSSSGTPYPAISTPTVIPPSNPCVTGYSPGVRQTIYTLPYNLSAILPHISSFADISWTGQVPVADPQNRPPLNGSDNRPGTSRAYTLPDGARIVETLLNYSSSDVDDDGERGLNFVEVHSIAPVTLPLDPNNATANLTTDSVQYGPPAGTFSMYAAADRTAVTPSCGNAAATFNLTATFCATNASAAEAWFRARDFNAMGTLGRLLGGGGLNVTNCADVAGGGGDGEPAGQSSAASSFLHRQMLVPAQLSMGTAVTLVMAGCVGFAALMV